MPLSLGFSFKPEAIFCKVSGCASLCNTYLPALHTDRRLAPDGRAARVASGARNRVPTVARVLFQNKGTHLSMLAPYEQLTALF